MYNFMICYVTAGTNSPICMLLFVKGLAFQAYHLVSMHALCQGLMWGGGYFFLAFSGHVKLSPHVTSLRVSNMFVTRTNFDKIKLTYWYTCSYEPMIQTPYNHDCQPSNY